MVTRRSFNVTAGAGGGNAFDTRPQGAEMGGGRNLQNIGQAVTEASTRLQQVQLNAAREANELRVSEALNKARERAVDLTYNTDNGYSMLQGQNALERPDGKSLTQEYSEMFEQELDDIQQGLSNDYQQQQFNRHASQLKSSFNSDLDKHTMMQFRDYHASVADGAIKLAMQEAQLFWNDPAKVDSALNGITDPETGERMGGIRQAYEQKARLTGMSENELKSNLTTAESNLHTNVIQTALVNRDVGYADDYFKKHKNNMTGKNILEIQSVLQGEVDAHLAQTAVGETAQEFGTAFIPDDLERLDSITNSLGVATELPEVEEGENANRELLTGKLREFGDVGQALAAYKAGDDAVRKAVKAAEDEGNPGAWLSKLPAKTREYVNSGIDKFASGGGSRETPTEMEFVNSAIAKLGDDASPSARTKARELAEKQYKTIIDARATKADEALRAAQQRLIENGGSMAQLPADMRMALAKYDPTKLQDATKFADAVRKSDDMTTDSGAYIEAVTNPGALAKMTDANFEQYLRTKFSQDDHDEIIKLRAGVMSGTSNKSTDTLDTSTVKNVLDNHLVSMGINPNVSADKDEDKAQKVARMYRFVRSDLFNQQQASGRKLTPREIEERIDYIMTRTITVPRGIFSDRAEERFIDIGISDIPNNVQEKIKQGYTKRGIVEPTNDDIIRAYWRLRVGQK